MNSGHAAEAKAAESLARLGFEILERNWKTRFCEIDIIAQRHNRIYFVEVKYRQHQTQGSGLDYITNKKLKKMSYAAETWSSLHNWEGERCLAAIEVSGDTFQVGDLITEL